MTRRYATLLALAIAATPALAAAPLEAARRAYAEAGFAPIGAVADASAKRIFVMGTAPQPGAQWPPAYVQAYDARTGDPQGEPASVGRLARQVLAGRDEVFVVGHAERDGPRAAVFVMDAATLALRKAIFLPEGRAQLIAAQAVLEPSGALHVLDTTNDRLLVVAPATGEVRAVDVEPGATAISLHGASVVVSFPPLGYAGIFSAAGERLDTLPLERVPPGGEGLATAVANYTDVWVDPGRPGSGVFIDQQGATLFATLFTQDPHGDPTWMFMSNGVRQADGSFAGDLYRMRGPRSDGARNFAAVGSLRFHPGKGDAATVIYYADGTLHTRSVQRFRFGEAGRQCRWSASPEKAIGERTNFTALWSNPADPGWGIAVSHLGDTAFALLFTYDEAGRPAWLVMSRGKRNAQGAFTGELYRAARGRVEAAGTLSLAFSGADAGTLRYRLAGLDFYAPILRHTFARLTTECS